MASEYPDRPMAANWVRYFCMAFGLANIVAGIVYATEQDWFLALAGPLVGGAWFAYGKYGGMPLIDTVNDWHPPATPDSIDEMHRRGLLVMRHRRWVMWVANVATFAGMALVIPVFVVAGHPELALFIVGVPLAIVHARYLLSRCPRCGLGFFTKSAKRSASIRRGRRSCGNCGLPLRAYKQH